MNVFLPIPSGTDEGDNVFDLIVVGAGPAGSAAARAAGSCGLKVLLLEKAFFPRDKPCGGLVSQRALGYLDISVPAGLREREVYGARVHYGGQLAAAYSDHCIGTLVTRSELDNYLLQQAVLTGIEVRMGEKVVAYQEEPNSVTVISSTGAYRARYVVIAEGAQGHLKYSVQGRPRKQEFALCLTAKVPATDTVIDAYIRNGIEVHLGLTNRGYGWVFPHAGYFSVGIGGLACSLREPRKAMEEFLCRCGFTAVDGLQRHMVPAGGIRRRVHTQRVLLVGDAAGFVDAFSGEGIAYAIRSGQIAAEQVFELLGAYQKQEIEMFAKRCQTEFGDNLRYALQVAKLVHRFPTVFFHLLSSSETAVGRYLDVAAGQSSYAAFMYWLLAHVPEALLLRSRKGRTA